MAKIEYESNWTPSGETLYLLNLADEIAQEYAEGGYGLTLRQLYYQFVARDHLPNSDRSYKRLGSIVSRGRMTGRLDWAHLTDRTRNPHLPFVGEPPEIGEVIRGAKYGYGTDKWAGQDVRVEVWVEKEALGEVVQRAASRYACGSLACKGYMSQSEMWEAGKRFTRYIAGGQRVVVLHLGDHDPSGIDMTRDIRDRLETFVYGNWAQAQGYAPSEIWGGYGARENDWDRSEGAAEVMHDQEWDEPALTVERIALNMDQIRRYQPPPNPAKLTDSRGSDYVERYGSQSWELDALPPDVLTELIRSEIRERMDADKFNAQVDLQQRVWDQIDAAAEDIAARYEQGGDDGE